MTSGSVLEVEILNPYKSFSAIILLNNLLSPPTFIFFSEILMTQKADLSLQSHRSLTCCSFFFFFQSVFLLSELQVGTSMQFCLLIYHFFPLLWSPSLEFEISLIVFFSSKTSVWFFRSSVSSLRLFFFPRMFAISCWIIFYDSYFKNLVTQLQLLRHLRVPVCQLCDCFSWDVPASWYNEGFWNFPGHFGELYHKTEHSLNVLL